MSRSEDRDKLLYTRRYVIEHLGSVDSLDQAESLAEMLQNEWGM